MVRTMELVGRGRMAAARLAWIAAVALSLCLAAPVQAHKASPPSPPSSLTAQAGDGTVSLSWGASTTSGIAGYRVYRTTTGTWSATPIGTTSGSTLTYRDSGLTDGTAYSYRVTAYTTAGDQSSPSNVVSATPVAPPPPPPASTYSGTVAATTGLVSYWRLGEASGTTAADSKGPNAGTYTGGYTLGVPGAIAGDGNTAVSLDGSSGYVSVPSSSSLTFGDNVSVEAWVKRGAVSTTADQVIASKQNGSWVLMLNSSNALVLRRSGVADVVASTLKLADTSAWHYVAATKSGGDVHLYIDGQDVTGTVSNQTMVDNTLPLAIGESAGGAFFQGAVDEIAVYGGALPAATISQHYSAAISSSSTSSDPVIAAAGDISCAPTNPNYNGGTGVASACQQLATSNLVVAQGLAAVLPLGDTQYDNGTLSEFQTAYDPTWGRVKAITHPAVGNHEYNTAGAAGYFDYFDGIGAATGPAGDRSRGYYSFDIGSWHIVALNSECSQVGGCGVGSPQEQWLKSDLAAHPATCTLAYWHRPLFNSSFTGTDSEMQPIWQDLYDANSDVVLNGHAHDYERFAPQTPSGALDPARGIREFVSGTGGEDHHSIGSTVPNSEVHNDATFGVLKLTLHATGYDWQWVPVAGGSFTDSGSGTCH